jgi:CheY-like chemotaxis protein
VKKILIVDDDPSMRAILRLIFEMAEFEVVLAPHGAAALAQLKGVLPDVVTTDLMMPVMGGAELIRQLRADPALMSLPILVVSSNPDAEQIARMADAVMGKPFLPAKLLETVNGLLSKEAG